MEFLSTCTVYKSNTTGLNAGFLLPQVPKNTVALTHDSLNQSPFFTETIQSTGQTAYATIDELSATGNYYNIQLQVPQSAMGDLRGALRTLTLPPVATVTDAVDLIERRVTSGPQLWTANSSGQAPLTTG